MINKDDYNTRTNKPASYLGNYRLIRLLGHGGFAAVFLGEHRYLQRLAAIKVLRTVLTEQEQAHFLEEARLLANLSHPHIVRVLEFAVASKQKVLLNSTITQNVPFLVMDYMSGGSLRTRYPMGNILPLDMTINYVKQVASALEYAHQKHIIHRDIKPENLLLNEQKEVMLSDFGLALFAPQNILLSRQDIAGTLPYTAPEQLRGKPVFASDQYSLAIVAYEWLSGYPPFRGGDAEVIMHHISSPPPSLISINPSVPPAMENVIFKALAKDPAQRYVSIQTFAHALEQAGRTANSYAASEFSSTSTNSLLPKNVLPFFYYFSQKPVAAPPSENQVGGTTYPLATNLNIPDPNINSMSPSKRRNRQRMIQKVRAFWITGVLEPSLQDAPVITPELREKQDAVAQPWTSALHHTQTHSNTLAAGASILQVYDQAGGELLILGEAGSGKTTLLLQLARDLLDRAEQDASAPVPVVFPLSSWAEKQLPIEQWLIEELSNKYQVPRLLGGTWMRAEAILPLLDGLDEVAERARSACITAINTYKQEHGLIQMVVCSRLTDYLLFPPRVLLQRAVVVQSLTTKQVEDYFLRAGAKFRDFPEMLHNDALLYGLITTPLMLNIIMLAYQDKSPTDLLILAHSAKERYGIILDTYVDQMLQRHPTRSILKQELINKLAYLAKKMRQNGQIVFYIEQMQPQWIDKKKWLPVYMWLATLLPGALIGALTGLLVNILLFHAGSIGSIYVDTVYGTIMGYLLSNRGKTSPASDKHSTAQAASDKSFNEALPRKGRLTTAFFVGLITFLFLMVDKGWAAGLANGVLLAVLSFPIQAFLHRKRTTQPHQKKPDNPQKTSHPLKLFFAREHYQNGFLIGVACGLTSVVTLLVNHNVPGNSLVFLLVLLLRDSLRNTLVGILLSLLLVNNDGIIRCAEIISWSWKKFFQSFASRNTFYDLLIGLIIGIFFGSKQLLQGSLPTGFSAASSTGLLVAIGLHLISAFRAGISSNKLNDHDRFVPNEGIKRSFSYGLISFAIGTTIAVFFTIATTLLSSVLSNGLTVLTHASTLQASLHNGLMISLLLGPAGGLLAALLLGWLAGWQHTILRLILFVTQRFPLNLSGILDSATTSLLLRKTGGGYIFIHRSLLEYFAACADRQSPPNKQTAPQQPEPLVRLL